MTSERLAIDKTGSWRRDFGWLVRLILILFTGFSVAFWLDLLFKMDAYDQWIGSRYACRLKTAHCSWSSYFLAQIIPSLLAIAAIVPLSWRRLPRREAVLNTLALAACVFVVWSVVETVLSIVD